MENVTAAIESAPIFWPDTFSTDNSFHGGLGSDGRAERFPFLTRGGLRGSEWDVFLAGQQQQQCWGTDPGGEHIPSPANKDLIDGREPLVNDS